VVEDKTLRVTASIGLHGAKLSAKDDCDGLIRHADNALYEAKESGRNRTVVG
jgi:diguanylate cyclase (GGDEF)-like protein